MQHSERADLTARELTATDSMADVRARVDQVRRELGMSKAAAARAAGMDFATYWKLLREGNPTLKTLTQIAGAWGVPLWVFTAPEEIARPYVAVARSLRLTPPEKILQETQ